MANQHDRDNAKTRGIRFSLRDLLLAVAILGCVFGLLALWLGQMRASSRKIWCVNQLRQLGLALNNHENSKRRFPLVSTSHGPLNEVPPGKLGDDLDDSAGCSFLFKIVPYMEERSYPSPGRPAKYVLASPSAFSPENVLVTDGKHMSTEVYAALRCPEAVACRAPLTAQAADYAWLSQKGDSPATGNYVALVGTHFDAAQGVVENGVIVSYGGGYQGRGIRLEEIRDGTSHTLLLSESRERDYAAWYDGQASWVVGTDGTSVIDRHWSDDLPRASLHLVNVGATRDHHGQTYSDVGLQGKKGWPGAQPRRWGPSSVHPGNVVVHVFADNHAVAISADIHPSVYYSIITRDGNDILCDGLR